MRPRYTWSAVCACSESRDRMCKFGRGHFLLDVISGSIGCLVTRPRYSCSAASVCIQSRDTRHKSGRGRSKSTSLRFRGYFCCIAILTLETEASRFLGKYQSYANETAIYVVSGVCLFRITWQNVQIRARSLPAWCHFRQYWLPGNETAIFLFSGLSLYIVTWHTSQKWAWSLKIDLPAFPGLFLPHSNFDPRDWGKPISRKISILREWDRDIRGQRCVLVPNHVTEFANSGVVTSCLTSFSAVLVAWQRDRDILVQRLEFVYSHVTHVTKVGVVAQNRPPCVSGAIFAA